MNTSAPATCDFGQSYIGAQRLFLGDETMDFFIFFGEPKEILDAYTNVTRKESDASLVDLWHMDEPHQLLLTEGGSGCCPTASFQQDTADVIHFDTGWFGVDWQCDYEFSKERFPDPEGMLRSLKKDGFHACLWQLPYFTPKTVTSMNS